MAENPQGLQYADAKQELLHAQVSVHIYLGVGCVRQNVAAKMDSIAVTC